MLTVKVDALLEAEVEARAALEGISKSEFVRRALRARLGERAAEAPSVYEVTRDLCGKAKSGDPGLSTRKASELMRERAGGKTGHR